VAESFVARLKTLSFCTVSAGLPETYQRGGEDSDLRIAIFFDYLEGFY
jgi:hypothetical protein